MSNEKVQLYLRCLSTDDVILFDARDRSIQLSPNSSIPMPAGLYRVEVSRNGVRRHQLLKLDGRVNEVVFEASRLFEPMSGLSFGIEKQQLFQLRRWSQQRGPAVFVHRSPRVARDLSYRLVSGDAECSGSEHKRYADGSKSRRFRISGPALSLRLSDGLAVAVPSHPEWQTHVFLSHRKHTR